MSDSKQCSNCGAVKALVAFSRDTERADGRHSQCKACKNARERVLWWADRERRLVKRRQYGAANRRLLAASKKRWHQIHPGASAAGHRVRRAIHAGILTRLACENCGSSPAEAHHDSYLPEHYLDLRWLCHSCHRAWHREHPSETQRPATLERSR